MASAELSRRVEKVVGYPPLRDLDPDQRREFHEPLLDAESFEDLPGKWQAAIVMGGAEPAQAPDRGQLVSPTRQSWARRTRRLLLARRADPTRSPTHPRRCQARTDDRPSP